MTEEHRIVERMRRAFAADDSTPNDRGDCPSPDELWDASHARLDPARAREIVRHISRCSGCSAEWRLAMRENAAVVGGEAPEVSTTRSAGRRWIRVGAVAAAVMVVALIPFVLDFDRSPRDASFRSAQTSELRSLTPEQHGMARDACVLRWSSVGDDAVYDLEVSRQTLEPVLAERGLVRTEYTISPDVLAAVPIGEPIVWRVEARLPDGRRVSSPSYVQSID